MIAKVIATRKPSSTLDGADAVVGPATEGLEVEFTADVSEDDIDLVRFPA